jgi:hypothetical protein
MIYRTMTPKEKAESLVHNYRMLLMAYGEDYGEELLVTFPISRVRLDKMQ